jgi:hypothetical protein
MYRGKSKFTHARVYVYILDVAFVPAYTPNFAEVGLTRLPSSNLHSFTVNKMIN